MNLTSVLVSLQMALTLLMGVQNNSHATNASAQQAIIVASQAVQQAVQYNVAPMMSGFQTSKNNSIWPNITDLNNAVYMGPDGGYMRLSAGGPGSVQLVGEDTSFGDINGDGSDDAAVVVQRTHSNGNATLDLAIMLNQNGVMFNVADAQLGDNVQILSHHVVQGGDIVLNTQVGTNAAQTSTYKLLGEQLIKL
jgi:hypothetical protein